MWTLIILVPVVFICIFFLIKGMYAGKTGTSEKPVKHSDEASQETGTNEGQ